VKSGTAVAIGRTARGTAAMLLLFFNALFALAGIFGTCCIAPPSFMLFAGAASSAVVCAAALPPFSERLRNQAFRWALAPLLLPSAWFTVWLFRDTPAQAWQWLLVPLATFLCIVYVAIRVLPGRRHGRR